MMTVRGEERRGKERTAASAVDHKVQQSRFDSVELIRIELSNVK